jgi:hypothetical protein
VALLPFDEPRARVIDRFGESCRAIAEFQPVIDSATADRKEIQSWYELEPADKTFVVHGRRFTVQISACAHESEVISNERVYKRFGREKFLELAKVALGVLRKELPEELWPSFISTTQTGRRHLQPVAKAEPVRAASKRAA